MATVDISSHEFAVANPATGEAIATPPDLGPQDIADEVSINEREIVCGSVRAAPGQSTGVAMGVGGAPVPGW
jgi:hypothetical protein